MPKDIARYEFRLSAGLFAYESNAARRLTAGDDFTSSEFVGNDGDVITHEFGSDETAYTVGSHDNTDIGITCSGSFQPAHFPDYGMQLGIGIGILITEKHIDIAGGRIFRLHFLRHISIYSGDGVIAGHGIQTSGRHNGRIRC